VQKHAGEVVAPGVGTIDLAIKHVREPGEWMPVTGVKPKGPGQAVPRQARLDPRIVSHILLIVIIDETVLQHGQVQAERDQRQPAVNQTAGSQLWVTRRHDASMMRRGSIFSIANEAGEHILEGPAKSSV
jgi:hypothetical protein